MGDAADARTLGLRAQDPIRTNVVTKVLTVTVFYSAEHGNVSQPYYSNTEQKAQNAPLIMVRTNTWPRASLNRRADPQRRSCDRFQDNRKEGPCDPGCP